MARAPRIPAALGGEIATTANGRDITRPWVGLLQEPRDPRLLRSIDWGVYEQIRKDDQVKATFGQRIGAVVSKEWDVIPGDDAEPRSVEAAGKLKANLQRIGWDRVTSKMLWASFYGISAAEIVWSARDGLIGFEAIKVRHARRFRYDKDGNLRLLTTANINGELLPERKFWVVTDGADNDDEPYGHGLADWLYWPTLFKRNGVRFWNVFLDKFGTPTAKGTYRRGTPKADIDKLLQALQAMATDSGIAVPEGVTIELLAAAKSGTADFEKLCRYMDEAIAKIVLGQTMTTQDGSSRSQAEVHEGVRDEIVATDSDMLSDSFNNGPARWWTDINFGVDVASPEVVRIVEQKEDTKKIAETDEVLDRMGYRRTDESFKDTYGDGYEAKAPATPPSSVMGLEGEEAEPRARSEDGNVLQLRKAASFAELEEGEDEVDALVDQLIAESGFTPIDPIMTPIADAIARSGSADELDRALLASLDQSDVDKLVETLAEAGFKVHLAAELGVNQEVSNGS